MTPGQKAKLNIVGTGQGTVSLNIAVNHVVCGAAVGVSFYNGAHLQFSIPVNTQTAVRSVTMSVGYTSTIFGIKPLARRPTGRLLNPVETCAAIKSSLQSSSSSNK